MKKISTIALALISCVMGFAQEKTTQQRLTDHVYYLASDGMRGREAGSEDAFKAMEYIKAEYEAIGLKPLLESGWELVFRKQGKTFRDVVGIIEGSDPDLRSEYIVLGAHYDHLGVKSNGEVFNGADDNASGSAALIEVARQLYAAKDQLKRSVIIAAFDAEELGLFGSEALADTLDGKLGIIDDVKLMMSLDMVGWYGKSGKLILEGTSTIRNGKRLAQAEAEKFEINVRTKRFETSVFTATDTEGFAERAVPTLAVTTGLKSPYHKPEDDPELIDYAGMSRVTDYISDFTLTASSDPDFRASGKLAQKHDSRVRPLEFGLEVSSGSGMIDFPKSAISTRSSYSWNAGVSAQLNSGSGHFAFRASALYEQLGSCFPSAENLYSKVDYYRQDAITVPAIILVQARNGASGIYAGVGGYFSQVLEYRWTTTLPGYVDQIQGGLAGVLGFRIGHISFEYNGRRQIGNLFEGESSPKAKLLVSYATLRYNF